VGCFHCVEKRLERVVDRADIDTSVDRIDDNARPLSDGLGDRFRISSRGQPARNACFGCGRLDLVDGGSGRG